jgi:hypothetical protein
VHELQDPAEAEPEEQRTADREQRRLQRPVHRPVAASRADRDTGSRIGILPVDPP